MLNRNVYSVFSAFPLIVLKDVNLRQLHATDSEDFFNYMTHPNVKKYLSEQDTPKSLGNAEEELRYWAGLFNNMQSIYWGIACKKNNKLIGSCGFNLWNKVHNRVELSYDLSPEHWGKGIMTEAVEAITRFAFEDMNVVRAQATVVYDNIGSIKVLEKAGYSREGMLKNYSILHDKVVDSYMYSRVK